MCGICGLFHPRAEGLDGVEAERAVRSMTALLARRGPDDESFFADPEGRLRLGFRRLAILDLSVGGRQPRRSASRRSVLAFNGEIYNYRELRAELAAAGRPCRTESDSEVLIEALELWQLAALPKLRGMFAFAWYELDARRLTLARDPFGIKPLYYAHGPDGALAFGSQYDLFWRTPWPAPDAVDGGALRLLLQLGHVPAPYGLMRGTRQLEPGGYLRCDPDGLELGRHFEVPGEDQGGPPRDETRLVDELGAALEVAVDRHRLADVPLGVFLSGGVDSPLVAAVARGQTSAALRAYTVGNAGWGQDEAIAARAYAAALEVDHQVLDLEPEGALAAVDDLVQAQHEPFADFSALPTFLLSRFARRDITVALSGDGGDELFFGYERPLSLLRDGGAFAWPRPARAAWWAARRLAALAGGRRASDAILFATPGDYYLAVNSRMSDDVLRRLAPDLPPRPADFATYRGASTGDPRALLAFARRAELLGQLQRGLKKVDMASMACGLEVRVPLLDLDLARWAFAVDPRQHVAGERKRLLAELLRRHLPPALLPKRKLGFSWPLADLLRGKLKPWAEALLLEGALFPAGFFARDAVERYWRDHQERKADHKWGLWALLMLQGWARRQGIAPATP
jgi:asparagine synthase (glutamine-hydrolysing)